MGLFLSGWMDPARSSRTQVDTLLSRVRTAEDSGFSSVWVGQHFLAQPRPVLDTDVFLGRIVGETRTVEVGGVYLLPLQHPVHLAESLMSLDNISGGRFILCGALGWAPREFAALGVPIKQRVARFEETLHVMRRLWSEDEPWSHRGRFYSFDDILMVARSENSGGIPVWMGASSVAGVRRAARLGATWLGSSHTPLEDLRGFAQEYGAGLAEAGHVSARRPLLRHCMVAETTELAVRRFVEAFEQYYTALGDWGIFRDVVGEAHSVGRAPGGLPPGRAIVGSPEDVREQIAEYQRLGFNEIVFQVGLPGTPESHVRQSLELLGNEVLPDVHVGHPLDPMAVRH